MLFMLSFYASRAQIDKFWQRTSRYRVDFVLVELERLLI